MAQWVNRLRNNIFINLPTLPLLCEISGALHLAQPGLTAGRQVAGVVWLTLNTCTHLVIYVHLIIFRHSI